MNRATLEQREEWFKERLAERGKFEYIGGYKNMKEDVILRHKKCGNTVVQKAYTVIYNSIDKCYECDRHRRGYDSIQYHDETLGIVDREKFGTRYRYLCKCKVCGEMYYFSKSQLENGITCCDEEGVSRIDTIAKARAVVIARDVRHNDDILDTNNLNLFEMIKASYNEVALLRTCVADTKKFFTKIQKEVEIILDKKQVGQCPICNKKIKNKTDWRTDLSKKHKKICKSCRKKQKMS